MRNDCVLFNQMIVQIAVAKCGPIKTIVVFIVGSYYSSPYFITDLLKRKCKHEILL